MLINYLLEENSQKPSRSRVEGSWHYYMCVCVYGLCYVHACNVHVVVLVHFAKSIAALLLRRFCEMSYY